MVNPDNATKIWTNYLETKFPHINPDRVDLLTINDLNSIRQEYFYERKQSWKLIQEIIRLGTTATNENSNEGTAAANAISSTSSPYSTLLEALKPKRLMDILLKHFDTFNHWYPIRYSFDQIQKIPILKLSNLEIQKEFIYLQKMEWILYTFQEEILLLLDTMILLTYKKYHLSYQLLENITKILLSDSFNRLSSLWMNYCPSQSSQTLSLLSLAVEQLNFKFIILFAESLQFWRIFLTKEEQDDLNSDNNNATPNSRSSPAASSVPPPMIGIQTHPLSDPKEPIPIKDMINICKNVLSNTSMNQLMLLPSSTALTTSSHPSGEDGVGGRDSLKPQGIIHKSTRNMLVFLWIKFITTYQGIESLEEDWNQIIQEDGDILDESYEENIIEHFTQLTRRTLHTAHSSSSSSWKAVKQVQSDVSLHGYDQYLQSIQATILQEMINVFIKFRVLKYRQHELAEANSIITLIQLVFEHQYHLYESFYSNWESFHQLYTSFRVENDDEGGFSYIQQEELDAITNIFPIVDMLYLLLKQSSKDPIYLVKLLLALFPTIVVNDDLTGIDLVALKKKSGSTLLSILNFSTLFITEEPFEYLKQSEQRESQFRNPLEEESPSSSRPSNLWLETVPSEIGRNSRVIYAHDQYYDINQDKMIDRDDINVHGGLWGANDDSNVVDPPFSLHWYERNSSKRTIKSSRLLQEDLPSPLPSRHSVYPIRGPFYSYGGRVIQANYDQKQCMIVWDEKFTWMETLLDSLLISFLRSNEERSLLSHQQREAEDSLLSVTIELFSRLSASEFTNLQTLYSFNTLWNKIGWSIFLKQTHCFHLLTDVLQPPNESEIAIGAPSLLELYRQSEANYQAGGVKALQNFLAQFFYTLTSQPLEVQEVENLSKYFIHAIQSGQHTPSLTEFLPPSQKRLFSSFSEILVSLIVSRLHQVVQRKRSSSTDSYEVEVYHQLQQIFHILIAFTTTEHQGNTEFIDLLLQKMTNIFQEKWILVVNQFIDQEFSTNHQHYLLLKYKLKISYYQILTQLLHYLQFVNVMTFQQFTRHQTATTTSSSTFYVYALVTISNLELFVHSELENISILTPASIGSAAASSSGGSIYDSIVQQSHALAMDQKKLIKEYLVYLTSLLNLFSRVQTIYLQYRELLQKRKLSYSKETLEFVLENVFTFSFLLLDQEYYTRSSKDVVAPMGSLTASSVESKEGKKSTSAWKELFKRENPSDGLQSTVKVSSTTSSNASSNFTVLPLPFDEIVENHYLFDYLSLLTANTVLGFELLQFFLQQNESVIDNYADLVSFLFSYLIDYSPSQIIRYYEIFFHRSQGLLEKKGSIRNLPAFNQYNGVAAPVVMNSLSFPSFNCFLLFFGYISFSLQQYHLIEAKKLRLLSVRMLQQLVAFQEYYYIYDRNLTPTTVQQRKTLIEIIGNANIYHLNTLLMSKLSLTGGKASSFEEEQIAVWQLLRVLVEYHPNVISVIFSFDSASTLSSHGSRKGSFGSVSMLPPLFGGEASKKGTSSSSSSSSKESNLIAVLMTAIQNMEETMKGQPLVMYAILRFLNQLILKAKLFPVLGKMVVYIIQQDKFWDQILKPLLSINHHVSTNRPSSLLNECVQSYETMDIGLMRSSSEPSDNFSVTLPNIIQSMENSSSAKSAEASTESSLLQNPSVKKAFHLVQQNEKDIDELQHSVLTYQQQLLLLSSIFHLLSLERYGIFYELNIEVAIKITKKINEIFTNAQNKSKFWNWIQHFLHVHIHHSILPKTENELIHYQLTLNDFSTNTAASTSQPNCVNLLPIASPSSYSQNSSRMLNTDLLAGGLESLFYHHFHYSPVLLSNKFDYFRSLSKVYNHLHFINYHYSITIVDTLVLFHWKEFLQLFILPGSLTKQYIARYKQERQQEKQQKEASGESKSSVNAATNSPSLTSFSSDIGSSPVVGALSPETQQPDASPMSIRESAFSGDKRSYEIVNEIVRKLTQSLTTNHSVDVHDPYHSPSSSSPSLGAMNASIGNMGGGGTSTALTTNLEQDSVKTTLSSSSTVVNIQFILQSLFGLISISQQTSLLINMIHHQLKMISFKDMNPEKSIVVNRDIGSARLTEDKIERLLSQLFLIYQSLFPSQATSPSTSSFDSEEEKLNAVFYYWKEEVAVASGSQQVHQSPLLRAIFHNKQYQQRIKRFLTSSAWNSTSSMTIQDIYSFFHELVNTQSKQLAFVTDGRNEEELMIVKLLNQLPYSYYKYQIRSSIFTSILLLFNTVQFYAQRSSSSLASITSSSSLNNTVLGGGLSRSAGSTSGKTSSSATDEKIQLSIQNRLSAFQCSLQCLKQLLHYFGVTSFSTISSTPGVTKPGATAAAPEMKQIQYLTQILLQIIKVSLPKKAPESSSSSPSTNIDITSMNSILSDPMYFKQFISIFFQEDLYSYWLALLQYLTPFILPMVAVQHDYSSLPIIVQSADTAVLPRHYRASMHGNVIHENDLKIDPQQDSDYLSIATVVVDFSNSANSGLFGGSTAAGAAPHQGKTSVSGAHGVIDNVLQATLSIYDFFIYSIENHYFLTATQELAFYQQLVDMMNQSPIIQEYQRVLLSQMNLKGADGKSKSPFIPSLFMGYQVNKDAGVAGPNASVVSSISYRDSLFSKIWIKSVEIIEGIVQQLARVQSSASSNVFISAQDPSPAAAISGLVQSILQFLQSYESLLAFPLLTIGHYRYTLQQLQGIHQTYHLFFLLQQYPQFSLYKTYLPHLSSLLEVKALTYISNLSYYTSYAEDFYIDSHQIQLLSTGIIMNYNENVPILISEDDLLSMNPDEEGSGGGAGSGVVNNLFGWKEDSVHQEGGSEKKSAEEQKAPSAIKPLGQKPSFGRDLSEASAHVHFGSDQLFIISNPSSTMSSATGDLTSPPSSATLRAMSRQISTATPPPISTPGSAKPVSILKSASKRYSTDSDREYDITTTTTPGMSSLVSASSAALPPPISLARVSSVSKMGGAVPPSITMPSHALRGPVHRSTSSEARHLDRASSTLLPPPLLMLDNSSVSVNGGNGGGAGGQQIWKYRWGYYHYSHPYLSFVFLLEKQLLKTFHILQHYLRQILPVVDTPQEDASTSAYTTEMLAERYPLGKKMIFLSYQSQSLVEGIIHAYNHDVRGCFDMILTANNLLERKISLSQLKFSFFPLISFQQIQELRTKQDFYRFPVLTFNTDRSGGGTLSTGGAVIAAYDHLQGKINKNQILSTSHLYRILLYLISKDTKDRLALKRLTSATTNVKDPANANTPRVSGSQTPQTPRQPTHTPVAEKVNPHTANLRLQTLQNSFHWNEYQGMIMETIYLLVANLHHHSYAPMSQEIPIIQQLIDLQHLLSLYSPSFDSASTSSTGSAKGVSEGKKSPAPTTSSQVSRDEAEVMRLEEEWKKYVSYIYSWMEEIYYRLEQSIGIDFTDQMPMITPVKKEGKFR